MNQADKGRLQVFADIESSQRWWGPSASDSNLCEYLLLDGYAVVAERRDGRRCGDTPVERRLVLTAKGAEALAALRAQRDEELDEDGWWTTREHATWTEIIGGPFTRRESNACTAAFNIALYAPGAGK